MEIYHSLNHGIYCVDAAYMRDQLASLYIIQQGDEVALIDTGTQYSLANLINALDLLEIDHAQIKYIIPTHVHLDHAGGAGAMMEYFDQARLIIHPRGAPHMIDPGKLIESSISVYGDDLFRQLYGEIKPIDEARIDIAEDLDRYYLGHRELLFIDTPGHALHHFCIYDDQSQGIFTGDTFGLCYPPLKNSADGLIPTSTPMQFDPVALLASIDRLLSYQPERMYLTHFGAIDQPAHKAIGLKRWISDYVAWCEEINPLDAPSERQLQNKMRHMMYHRLSDESGLDQEALGYLLEMDFKLNCQGLAIWWRRSTSS